MTPNRTAIAGGLKVEQFYWSGRQVVYVDHLATDHSFDHVVELLKSGKTKGDVCVKPKKEQTDAE